MDFQDEDSSEAFDDSEDDLPLAAFVKVHINTMNDNIVTHHIVEYRIC